MNDSPEMEEILTCHFPPPATNTAVPYHLPTAHLSIYICLLNLEGSLRSFLRKNDTSLQQLDS